MIRVLQISLVVTVCTLAWGQKPWKTDASIIFLHRGARAVAPEGSIEAIHEAIRQGADGVEVDLRLTLDGHVINFHNKDTLVKGFGLLPVEWMTLAEVRALDMGSWFSAQHHGAKVATLEEIVRLALPNQLYLRIELKKPNVRDAVEAILDRYDAWHLLGSSVDGAFRKREVLSWKFLAKDLWMTGGEDDASVLKKLIKAHGKDPFRVNVDDCRILGDLLGRRPERREIRAAIPRRAPDNRGARTTLKMLRSRLCGEDQMDAWRAANQLSLRDSRDELAKAFLPEPIGPHAAEAAAFSLAALKCSKSQLAQLMKQAILLRQPTVTRMIAYVMGRRRMHESLPVLRRFAADGAEIRTRTAAVWALGELDDRLSIPLFRKVTDDGGADVFLRIQSVIAIGKIRDLGARESLTSALAKGPPPVSLLAVKSLGLLGHGESSQLLGRLLGNAKETNLKAWAVIALCNALARMGPQGEQVLLVHAGKGGPVVRREALYALARNGPSVVEVATRAKLSQALVERLTCLTRTTLR